MDFREGPLKNPAARTRQTESWSHPRRSHRKAPFHEQVQSRAVDQAERRALPPGLVEKTDSREEDSSRRAEETLWRR
jgi:hypothetical protein